jgi:Glycine zipper
MNRTATGVAAFAILTGITGCTLTEQGTVVGGVTGAAIGGAATGTAGGAIAGGAIGAFAGALVGQASEHGWCVYENRWGYQYRALCPPGR